MVGRLILIDNPEGYTIAFAEDGPVGIRADYNRGRGIIDKGRLKIATHFDVEEN